MYSPAGKGLGMSIIERSELLAKMSQVFEASRQQAKEKMRHLLPTCSTENVDDLVDALIGAAAAYAIVIQTESLIEWSEIKE